MYLKHTQFGLLIIFQILCLCSCDLENIAEGPSVLGLVYVVNADELEFQLKERTFNDSTKIEPTRTVLVNNNGLFNASEGGTYTSEGLNKVVWDKNPVPTVNRFYSFDKSAVEILLDFVKQNENIGKLSKKHLLLIKKYIFEWLEHIQEPSNRVDEKMNDELGIQNNQIPRAMGFQDIVLRNILRVQIELQKILDYSDDNTWREQVVDKIIETEALSGSGIFQDGEVEAVSSAFAQLSRTYNLHPFELYPQPLEKDSSFLSYIHAALHIFFRQHLIIALEWLEAGKSLLKDDVISIWKDILNQNENLPKSLQTEENYWLKLRTKRENYEREREEFVNQERAKLEKIFPRDENAEVKKDSECRKAGCSKDRIDYLYVDILINITANAHDEMISAGNETMKLYSTFFKPLKEESIYTQSRKEAKEYYVRKMPKINYDVDTKIQQEKLCRGISTKSTKELSVYSCRLDSRNSPYLLLMPVKVEDLNKDPEVKIFHHIIGDKKIHEFQQMTLPIADISKTGGAVEDATLRQGLMHRKSYVGWIHETSSQNLKSMNHVINYLTGYVTSEAINGSESLQVNSYVSGGFYAPHQDTFDVFENFFDKKNKLISQHESNYYSKHSHGDRLATFMIYMNDDMIGGRTVFPHLRLSVAPEKGSAIYWNNLHLNGSVNEQTLHAGCQVLAGVKWVANKWIRSNSQMFRRPCALERNM